MAICIKVVSASSGLKWRKCKSFLSPGTKQIFRNNELPEYKVSASVKRGLTVIVKV